MHEEDATYAAIKASPCTRPFRTSAKVAKVARRAPQKVLEENA
jgi:hypothetical protein